jgi:hypothetical protein
MAAGYQSESGSSKLKNWSFPATPQMNADEREFMGLKLNLINAQRRERGAAQRNVSAFRNAIW